MLFILKMTRISVEALTVFILAVWGRIEARPSIKSDITSFFTREKCIPELGCFSAGKPFFDIIERPLSLLPDDREDINTIFHLYTPQNVEIPKNFSNRDSSLASLIQTGFNPKLKTNFIVPGYISKVSPHWKKPLVEALLRLEGSNVFMVEWAGGDGPLYEQAVANTRVVGAEIALFVQRLQNLTGIEPTSVHIIGHSLGAHIAGYAGKNLTQSGLKLGRITGMDPAGPYFTNVDPTVRLDKGDARLVEAIHTNAAPSRFQGFGLTESIGHFDFFPNGGHLQPGCEDMGHAILSFLTHPSLDYEGLHEIMCNHQRSVELFISSIANEKCPLMGAACDSWEKYAAGQCGTCSVGSLTTCVSIGLHTDKYSSYISNSRSLNLYLNTTSTEPFCIQ